MKFAITGTNFFFFKAMNFTTIPNFSPSTLSLGALAFCKREERLGDLGMDKSCLPCLFLHFLPYQHCKLQYLHPFMQKC